MIRPSMLLTALLIAGNVFAAGSADSVTITDPWIRQSPAVAQAAGAFMIIKNTGAKEVKITKADNPASKVTELHNHFNEGGVMKMRAIPSLDIKAGGEAILKPGSLHVMLIGLKAPLEVGKVIPITLTFDDGSNKIIEATVKPAMPPPAAMPAAGHEMHKH
ncbi:MAG: copper chaperone PCu(A)C [Rhodocyclaceae bacterium]|nr:copper chaperone PCu(A)C [Rhodocyclaceae bacterium]